MSSIRPEFTELELTMSQPEFDRLEQLLTENAAQLRDETVRRCLQNATMTVPGMSDEDAARAGAEHTHELVMIVVALYPSETSLRQQYEWAATGVLDRRQVEYDHFALLLRVYFDVARDVLDASDHPVLDTLEKFMQRVLKDVFWGPADS